ncbi:MAG: hypothetical protein ABIS86_15305 [Streptosporangiaceae bacterium]
MGMIRSLLQINKQAKEIGKTYDPVAQARNGLQMMQAATAQLAQQNSTAHLAVTGAPGSATILRVTDTGTRINHEPMVELELLVTFGARPPYPVTLRSVVPIIAQGRLSPGQVVAVRVDQAQPHQAVVMWAER